MALDSTFWMASCTKLIVGIACPQLVEKGMLALDDPDQVERLCPEVAEVKVLQSDGSLVEKKRTITLRMLLNHTSGYGYTFLNEKLRDYSRPTGYDEFSGKLYDLTQPLVNQPGEQWEYGVGVDWAGILLERATGLRLNDYFTRNIFQPLGLESISMLPNNSMKSRLAYMHHRAPDSQLSQRDHLLRWPLVDPNEDAHSYSGGGGCFAQPQDYCQILSTLLNDGTSPKTSHQLLQKSTVDELFRNQIPQFPDFGSKGLTSAKPDLTNSAPVLYPSETPQGWGLGFMITGGATGRSDGTAHWAGMPNVWWWCDRARGVAGMIATQILPFADPVVLKLWADVEATVYKALS